MSTLGERIDVMRETVTARGDRIGLPRATTTLDMLDMLERNIGSHRLRVGAGDPWCLRCLTNWPCEEVVAAEELLRVIERTELGDGG